MRIGVPKEIKNHEYRVGLTPLGVRELTAQGHQVYIETKAGYAIGFDDTQYKTAGAHITADAAETYATAEMIVKVKEPQASECKLIREQQIIFSYLHLAAEPGLTKNLMDTGCIAIAFETVTDKFGGLPLLAPMSEVAGRLSVQAGAKYLEKSMGGSGVLLSGVPGVAAGKVTIIGGGVVGTNAAIIAVGMGAEVTIIDKSVRCLRELEVMFGNRVHLIYSTTDAIEHYVTQSDLVIGAVLIPGAAAPHLVTEEMVQGMSRGSVIVDVAIDQGGCIATSKPTTHEHPTYVVHDVVHYCVTNMPGAVAKTSARALENATLDYTLALANKGFHQAMKDDGHFQHGINVYCGKITYEAVAKALNMEYNPVRLFI